MISGVLGEGGFGIVYSAHDEWLGRTIAIKEYLPSAIAGRTTDRLIRVRTADNAKVFQDGLRRFLAEAKLLAQFSHPALVGVQRVWEENETAYMAMRLCPGRTARAARSGAPYGLNPEVLRALLMPVFDAVATLHARDVIHRDISPDNVMISPAGAATLLDLGAARTVRIDATQALTTLLKPGYAPIEQYVDDGSMPQGAWTDVYGLAALIYYMATGSAPPQAVLRTLNDSLVPLPVAGDHRYPQSFSDAITHALAIEPKRRLQTVRDLVDALGWSNNTNTHAALPDHISALRSGLNLSAPAKITDDASSVITATQSRATTAPTASKNVDSEATVCWQPSRPAPRTETTPHQTRQQPLANVVTRIPDKRSASFRARAAVLTTATLGVIAAVSLVVNSPQLSLPPPFVTVAENTGFTSQLETSRNEITAVLVSTGKPLPTQPTPPNFTDTSGSVAIHEASPVNVPTETSARKTDPLPPTIPAIATLRKDQGASVVAKNGFEVTRNHTAQQAPQPAQTPHTQAQVLASKARAQCFSGNKVECEQLYTQAMRADASWRLSEREKQRPELQQAYLSARAVAWGY